MPRPAKPIVHFALAFVLSATSLSRPVSETFAPLAEETAGPWNRAIAFTLEARSVERDAALGMHVVRPIFHSRDSAVLAEVYGWEGEGELGLVGGGLVYRRDLGGRSSFESSVFFDGIRSTDGFAYPQLGAGVAYSPDRWIALRANGYLPLRGKDSRRHGTEHWSETSGSGADRREVSFSRELRSERAPMRGFEVEAELRLPEPPRGIDPRIAVGYAYREAEDRPEVYAGLTARAELRFARHWAAEIEWRDDAHGADQEWRAGVRFQMLFGGTAERLAVNDGGKTGDGKGYLPADSSGGAASSAAGSDARSEERFLPVRRFPWPTMARGSTRGKTQTGESRSLAPAQAKAPLSKALDDCCNSGREPLFFD
ncbi:MAG TPA: hypothetical protein VF593_07080 [Chthoniobacteraceae bacterium]|jgi:hypothetical protein